VLRRFVLRRVASRVRMVARARNGDGREALSQLQVADGIAACGWGVVGMLRAFAERRPPPGLHLPDTLVGLDAVLERLDGCPDRARPIVERW